MRSVLRWIGLVVGVVAILASVAVGGIYIASERALRRVWDVPPTSLTLPTDPASIVEGRRLATLRGCFGGCHGTTIEGEVFADEPGFGRIVAPNLSTAVRDMTDADLERVIRHGVRRNGTAVFTMPSEMFHFLDDADLAAIIAFLRSEPLLPGPDYEFSPQRLARYEIATGAWPPQPAIIEMLDPPSPRGLPGSLEHGRYLALTVCSECHGIDLRGRPGGPPDLRVAAAYTAEQFATLMRTGRPPGGRDLGLMRSVALSRFSFFKDEEITTLYRYLTQ